MGPMRVRSFFPWRRISCPTANGMAASKAAPMTMESPSSTNLDTASFIVKILWVNEALGIILLDLFLRVFYLNGIDHLHKHFLESFISPLLISRDRPLSPIFSFF